MVSTPVNPLNVSAMVSDNNSELGSPICRETVQAAVITPCGHAFCHECIMESLAVSVYCPDCREVITADSLRPDFALDAQARGGPNMNAGLAQLAQTEVASLDSLNRQIAVLLEQRERLASDQAIADGQLLVDFLRAHLQHRQQELQRLQEEVGFLERDLEAATERLSRARLRAGRLSLSECEDGEEEEEEKHEIEEIEVKGPIEVSREEAAQPPEVPVSRKRRRGLAQTTPLEDQAVLPEHRRRMEELQGELAASYQSSSRRPGDGLDAFARRLRSLCRLSRLRPLANLRLADMASQSSAASSSNIISSIEFDRQGEVFVTAGVARRIRFYRYADALGTSTQVQVPLREIQTRAKLSSVSWNQYLEAQVASGDYEGIATVWDVARGGQVVATFEEHEKRIWSVDYSRADPMRLATGSDDAHVRVWSGRSKRSVIAIDGKANVCSVAFHPTQAHLLAFGSADHHVHLYDLRSTLRPLALLKGHRKAVSYVRWLGEQELVSASTDSQLRLWERDGGGGGGGEEGWQSKRAFSGHLNEKNFVGLAVQQDLIACGSENNSLFCYHRDLPSPLASLKFTQTCPLTGAELEADGQHFVSAVCWRRDGQLVVANSQGAIKIVQIE